MIVFKRNYQAIISKVLWLLLFVALGCSQRSCSCKRMETIRQEIVITDLLGKKTDDKFPVDFVNLLYIKNLFSVKDADTVLQRFKPNVTLKRLDTGFEISNLQKLGLNDWQRFIRSIFTLSPDNYDPDLENRFLTNEIGRDFSCKSQLTDSLKIISINQFLLNELQVPQRCKIYFYSSNINNNFYRCRIDLNDTAAKRTSGLFHPKQPVKKPGKGLGCANFETAVHKNHLDVRKIDTVFRILHSIDCINFLIAKNADSVTLNGSGCSVKDRTVKHIIVYEPPLTCIIKPDTIKLINIPTADTVCNNVGQKVLGPFRTSIPADSICWELIRSCTGITVGQLKWKGDSCVLSLKRQNIKSSGDLILKVTPFRDSLVPISTEIKVVVRCCDNPKSACKFILQPSTSTIKFCQGNTAKSNRQPLITLPNTPDSIVWELTRWSIGLKVSMPGNKRRGTKEIPPFEITKEPQVKRGTIIFKITPRDADCKAPRSPASSVFVFQFSLDSSHYSKNDTGVINQLRRQIINDFRELLFMYAKTQTPNEQTFFRTSALNKIREIPEVRVDIIPKNDIATFLDDIAAGSSAWALPKVKPIIDKRSYLIIGVTIEQK